MTKKLTVFDPRIADRVIVTDGGRWSSAEAGVVFFETDRYSHYTNPKYVGVLLSLLLSDTPNSKLGTRVSPYRADQVPLWGSRSNDELTAIVEPARLPEVMEFFDTYANHEIWNFYGVAQAFRSALFKPFPKILKSLNEFSFVLEIDLDGMLIGVSHAVSGVDRLVEKLVSLEIVT